MVEKDTANAVDNQTTSVRAEINQTLFENNRARNGGQIATDESVCDCKHLLAGFRWRCAASR